MRGAGYEVVKRTDSAVEPVRGERINEAEAAIDLQGVRGGEIAVRHRDRSEPQWHSRPLGAPCMPRLTTRSS